MLKSIPFGKLSLIKVLNQRLFVENGRDKPVNDNIRLV